jgi:hypothetical protein
MARPLKIKFFLSCISVCAALSCAGLAFVFSAPSFAASCAVLVRDADRPTRSLEQIQTLSVMTYNMRDLNLWSEKEKPEIEIAGLGAVITKGNPDVIVAQEVDRKSLQHLNKTYLGNQYDVLIPPTGNDPGGRQIGFLVKRDLPFDLELDSHAGVTTYNNYAKKYTKVFSRDLPVLLVRTEKTANPFLAIFGVHAKADDVAFGSIAGKISRAPIRATEFDTAAKLDAGYTRKYGEGLNRIFAGDFNTDVLSAPEMASLTQRNFIDARALAVRRFPRNSATPNHSQIDSLQISPSLQQRLIKASKISPPPEVEKLQVIPSDHLAQIAIFSTKGFWEKQTGTN